MRRCLALGKPSFLYHLRILGFSRETTNINFNMLSGEKTMMDFSDENVAKKIIIFGVNDRSTRSNMLKFAIISIYGVVRGWDSVIAYKDELSFSYFLFRYFGFLSMYIYVLKLVCCFGPSDPPHTTFKGRSILLAIMSLVMSVSMFYNCYTWQRWDVYLLTLSVIIATISLAQLIYGMDGLEAGYIVWITIFGSAWGIYGLYFDITSGSIICTFFITAMFQMAFTSVVYTDAVLNSRNN